MSKAIQPLVGRFPSFGILLSLLRAWLSLQKSGARLGRVLSTEPPELQFLISDRTDMARDNGESLFRQLIASGETRVRFAISLDSKCGGRLRRDGFSEYLVEPLSFDYWLALTSSRFLASSQRDVDQHAKIAKMKYGAARTPKVVYLRHGIQHTSNAKIDLRHDYDVLCCSLSAEIEHLNSLYLSAGKTAKSLRKIGMMRFDRYESIQTQKEDQILLMPTWRSGKTSLLISRRAQLGPYMSEWVDFAKQLSSLNARTLVVRHPLLDDRLLEQLKAAGATVLDLADIDFQLEIRKARVLVTDYSSSSLEALFASTPVVIFRSEFDRSYTDYHLSHSLSFDLFANSEAHICTSVDCAYSDTRKLLESPGLDERNAKLRANIFQDYPQSAFSELLRELEDV